MRAVADDAGLVAAARAGDERAFVELTSPHRRVLHVHCYRLLGSLHDADDALQETLLRAWRGIGRYEPRAPVRAWLYRIATHVCLRVLEQRAKRVAVAVDAHLEPYPEPAAAAALEPAALVESEETVGLAFVAATQLLPPKQRVVLVLRDVLDWSAREVADLLEDSEAAVNSALQPARAKMSEEHGSAAHAHRPPRRCASRAHERSGSSSGPFRSTAGSTESGSLRRGRTGSRLWRRMRRTRRTTSPMPTG